MPRWATTWIASKPTHPSPMFAFHGLVVIAPHIPESTIPQSVTLCSYVPPAPTRSIV